MTRCGVVWQEEKEGKSAETSHAFAAQDIDAILAQSHVIEHAPADDADNADAQVGTKMIMDVEREDGGWI